VCNWWFGPKNCKYAPDCQIVKIGVSVRSIRIHEILPTSQRPMHPDAAVFPTSAYYPSFNIEVGPGWRPPPLRLRCVSYHRFSVEGPLLVRIVMWSFASPSPFVPELVSAFVSAVLGFCAWCAFWGDLVSFQGIFAVRPEGIGILLSSAALRFVRGGMHPGAS